MLWLCMSGCLPASKIRKGYRLNNFQTESFFYDLWTYGRWIIEKKDDTVIDSYDVPFTLVVAVRPKDTRINTLRLADAVIFNNNHSFSLLPSLANNESAIQYRSFTRFNRMIKEPHAMFVFDRAITFHESFNLKLTFQEDTTEKVYYEIIEVSPYEEKSQKWKNSDVNMDGFIIEMIR